MRVVEIETQEHKVRYVVMDEEGKLVGPIVQYLKYLDRIGSARNTLRSYAAALRLYWEFLSQEQLEAELARDRWDARNIPGLRYAPHDTAYYVDFRQVPEIFRSAVKDYVRLKLEGGRSAKTLNHTVRCLGHFLTFYLQRYPSACTLHTLSSHDIEAFILSLKATAGQRGVKNPSQHIYSHLVILMGLLFYLERIEHFIKPNAPTTRIILIYHYPKVDRAGSGQVKYSPHRVLSQLDAHIQHLRPFYIPLVALLRASGWLTPHQR